MSPTSSPQHVLRAFLALREARAPLTCAQIAETSYWSPYGTQAHALVQRAILQLHQSGDLVEPLPGHYALTDLTARQLDTAIADSARHRRPSR